MERRGWTVTRLGTMADEEDEVLRNIADGLGEGPEGPVTVEVMRTFIGVAKTAAEVQWRVEGRSSASGLMEAHMARKLGEKINEARDFAAGKLKEQVPRMGKAKVVRWPTKLQRRLEAAGDNASLRESAEKIERTRWINELKKLMEEAGLPVMMGSAVAGNLTLSKRFGKGRRVATLRKHVKTWSMARNWFMATFDRPWPDHSEEFALYLEARANEPCGRSVPTSIFKTLMFMEHAGEVPLEDQMNRKPGVKNALEEVNMTLAEGAPGFTKKAWHIPVKLIMEMEQIVLESTKKDFIRGYAWYRLIKLWSGMRFADTQGLINSSLTWEAFGVTGVLGRTKTTGPGKKIQLLRIWISKDCWIHDETWLSTGYELWKRMSEEAGMENRDFMLPCPSKDLSGPKRCSRR